MSLQSPLPFAFAQSEGFLMLPLEKRTSHLWQAHKFCKAQIGGKRFADAELERNIRMIQRMLLEVAKQVAGRLREDGAWRNAQDARWPRNHTGADRGHWYDSGAFPPQFLSLPTDPTCWREVLQKKPDALFDEMIAWAKTPAGNARVGDEELQKLLADRDTYLPESERSDTAQKSKSADKPESEPPNPKDQAAALNWLADKSADGSLSTWASALKLSGIDKFLGGVSSNRRPVDRLLPELMKLEKAGEWEKLQAFLDVEAPTEAIQLAKLRRCLPKSRA